MKRNSSIKVNVVVNTFRVSLNILFPLVTFMYVSHIFLADGMGSLNFVKANVDVFTSFASLGISAYGIREGVKVRENKEDFSHFAQELLIINGTATFIVYIVFFLSICFVPTYREYRTLFLIYGVMIFFTAMGCDWIYGVYEEYIYIAVRSIIWQIFVLGAMIFLVHGRDDIYIWAVIGVAIVVGQNIFNMVRAKHYISLKKYRNYCISKHIIPIVILFSTHLAGKVYNSLDAILLGFLVDDYSVGIYTMAVRINVIMTTVFGAMFPLFVPRIIEFIQCGEKNEYYLFLNKIVRFMIAFSFPTVLGIEMLRKPIVILLGGDSFASAADTMMILSPIIVISVCCNILYSSVFVPNGKEVYVLVCVVSAAFVNLIISLAMIPYLHEIGAALGSLTAEFFALFLALIFAQKSKLISRICFPSVVPYLVGCIGVVCCCLITKVFFEKHVLIYILLSVISSILTYGCLLLLFREPLSQQGIVMIKKIMRGKNKL